MDATVNRLKQNGIWAERPLTRRRSTSTHVDVVAWGCVRIEVKSSTPLKDGQWQFQFQNQRIKGIKGHLVVLIPMNDDGIPQMYSVFPSDFHAFYIAGKLKGGVRLIANPAKRHHKHSVLTMQDMIAHADAWHLIEGVRQQISKQLPHGIGSPQYVNKPAEKPLPLFEGLSA